MPVYHLPGGGVAFVCTLGREKRCSFCAKGYADKLCDFPLGRGKTCDRPMCDRCATAIAHEVDYCPTHRGQQPAQGALSL